jgi:transcriptional regulator with XRE-family HTH domain
VYTWYIWYGRHANDLYRLYRELPEAQISYGTGADDLDQLQQQVLRMCQGYTVQELARTAGLSVGEVSAVLQGNGSPSHETLTRLLVAAQEVDARRREERERVQAGIAVLRERCQCVGIRQVARDIGVDPANLTRVLAGRRRPSLATVRRWEAGVHHSQQ